jgi:hypothetical protein
MKPPNPSNFPTAVEDMAGLADELSELGGGAGDEADRRNQYKVVRADGLLLYSSRDLSMARAVFATWKACRPHGRYLLRQDAEVLERWPHGRD